MTLGEFRVRTAKYPDDIDLKIKIRDDETAWPFDPIFTEEDSNGNPLNESCDDTDQCYVPLNPNDSLIFNL
jgi:hypothetical protein